MYEIFALFLAGIIAVMGISGLELTLSYQRGGAARAASHVASDYLMQGERDYLSQVASYASNPNNDPNVNPITYTGATYTSPEVQACLTANGQSSTVGPKTTATAGAGGSTCRYYVTYTLQTAGASDPTGNTSTSCGQQTTGATSLSCNVNINAGEQRLSAIIIATVRNAPSAQSGAIVLAKKQRTITVRSFAVAPFAAVINSSDTQDPFLAASTHKFGGSGGTSEGDIAGRNGPGVDDSRIFSYAGCRHDNYTAGADTGSQTSMEDSWCAANASSVANAQAAGGTYNAAALPPPGTWTMPVSTSDWHNQTWNNGAGSTNSGN